MIICIWIWFLIICTIPGPEQQCRKMKRSSCTTQRPWWRWSKTWTESSTGSRCCKGSWPGEHPEAFSHVLEASFLEDDNEDPIPSSSMTTITTSKWSTGSCDTSPDTISPYLRPDFEDLSHLQLDSTAINGHSQIDDKEMLGKYPFSQVLQRIAGLSRCLRWNQVTLPPDDQFYYPILPSRSPCGTRLVPKSVEFLGVCHSHSFLTESISLQTLCQAREWTASWNLWAGHKEALPELGMRSAMKNT